MCAIRMRASSTFPLPHTQMREHPFVMGPKNRISMQQQQTQNGALRVCRNGSFFTLGIAEVA